MPYIQNADASNYYNLTGIAYMAPGAIIWVSQALYDNSAVIINALNVGEIVVATGISAPSPDEIPHQFETEFGMSIRSGATATSLQLQFMESLGGFEDSAGDLYDAGDTFITFRAELISNGVYLLWEGLQGEDPGDGSIALTLTNNENFRSGQSYPGTLGAGGGEYNLTTAVISNFIVTAEVSGGGQEYQQVVTVAKSGGDFTSVQSAIDSINDASASKIYTVLIYPGIYAENVTTGDYINLKGIDRDSCIIRVTSGNALTIDDVHVVASNLFCESTAANGMGINVTANTTLRQVKAKSDQGVGLNIVGATVNCYDCECLGTYAGVGISNSSTVNLYDCYLLGTNIALLISSSGVNNAYLSNSEVIASAGEAISLQTVSSVETLEIEHCTIKAGGDASAIEITILIATAPIVKVLNSILRKSGTATYSIDTSAAIDAKVALCCLNADLDVLITNLITLPNNVVDSDV